MSAVASVARWGFRVAAAGSSAVLALAIGTARDAAARIGFYADTTGAAEKLVAVVGGVGGPQFQRSGTAVNLYVPGSGTFTDTTPATTPTAAALVVTGGIASGQTVISVTGFAIQRAAGNVRDLAIYSGTSQRWSVRCNGTAEGGSDAGSDFNIVAFADDGTTSTTCLTIARVSTGAITFGRPTVTAQAAALNGTSGNARFWLGSAADLTKLDSQGTAFSSRTGPAIIFDGASTDRGEIDWIRGSRTSPEFSIRQHVSADTGGQFWAGPGTANPTLALSITSGGITAEPATTSSSTTTGSIVAKGGLGVAGAVFIGGLTTMGSSSIATAFSAVGSGSAGNITTSNSGTTDQPLILTLGHQTSGTPAVGFGGIIRFNAHSDNNTNRGQSDIRSEWIDATDATRKGRLSFWPNDTAAREALRLDSAGGSARVGFFGTTAAAQQGAAVDVDAALVNFGLKASGGGQVRTKRYVITAVNLNSATTDVGTFSGLPAKWQYVSLKAYDASTSLTTATVDLRTATSGGGTALVSASGLTAATAAAKLATATAAAVAGTDYQTATTLTVRNVTAQGGAATASFVLEIIDLT